MAYRDDFAIIHVLTTGRLHDEKRCHLVLGYDTNIFFIQRANANINNRGELILDVIILNEFSIGIAFIRRILGIILGNL